MSGNRIALTACVLAVLLLLGHSEAKTGPSPWVVKETDLDYEQLTPEEYLPRIVSQPKTITTVAGSSVELPCEIIKLGKYTFVWRKSTTILWVVGRNGQNELIQDVVKDDRIKLRKTSLLIESVTKDYAGDYYCEVRSTNQSTLQRLIVQEPPSVAPKNSGNFVNVIEGNSAELSCDASGIPPPTIHWEKEGRAIEIKDSPTLKIESVSLSDDAIYSCVAQNGVGESAKTDIDLNVVYPPKVIVPEAVIFSGVGYEVDLSCEVLAKPPPKVDWFKSTEGAAEVPLNQKKGMAKGNRYYVRIQPVRLQDFGEYICHASNFWGNESSVVELTGRPVAPVVTDVRRGEAEGLFILTWEVTSYSSIASYDVFYKSEKDEYDDWANVTVPGRFSNSQYQSQQYALEDIAEGENLLVKIKARNEFGDSEWSAEYFFMASDSVDGNINLATRATVSINEESDKYISGVSESAADVADGIRELENQENISMASSAQNDSNDSSNSVFILTPAQKKAQMVALITAISLSSFFS